MTHGYLDGVVLQPLVILVSSVGESRGNDMRKRLFEIIEAAKDGDKISNCYDAFMMVVIIASIVPLGFKSSYPVFNVIDIVSAAIFILDYLLRWFTADYKLNRGAVSFPLYPLTPLAIIDANAEVIEMIDGENEWTQSIRKQIKRLTALTEKLVYLSRMDEDGYKMQMESFDISQAAEDMTELFKTSSKARGITLKAETEEGLNYYGNEASIRQLISIMLDNALKYTDENGVIEVKLKAAGKNRILTFYNTVEEIEKGKLDFLFERFYRLDKSRNSETGGHGIGLSVAKAIAEAHGGKISAESTDGKSILFTVALKNIPNQDKKSQI